MSCSIEIPRMGPPGAHWPCLLRLRVIGDGIQYLGEHVVEVPVATDRYKWNRLRLEVDLLSPMGSLALGESIQRDRYTQDERDRIVGMLTSAGMLTAAAQVIDEANRTEREP